MKRIISVLLSTAMVLGIIVVALSASSPTFCGYDVGVQGAVTIDGTTATLQADSGDAFIQLTNLPTGSFSFEFDYILTTNPSENPFAIEIKAANWVTVIVPAGNHLIFEGDTTTGNYKLTVDGNATTGQNNDLICEAWQSAPKFGFVNKKSVAFKATISNLKVNESSSETTDPVTRTWDFEDLEDGTNYRYYDAYPFFFPEGDAKSADNCWGKTTRLHKDTGKTGHIRFVDGDLVGTFGAKFVIEMDVYVVDIGDNNKKFNIENRGNGEWPISGANVTLDENKWNHIAFILDTTTGNYRILSNGTQTASGTQATDTKLDIRIGFNNDSTTFDAYIDNVRIASGLVPAATAATATGPNHTPGDAVHENEVAAQPGVAGSYDEVVYCTVCEAEISRTTKTTPALSGAVVVDFNDQTAGQSYSGEYFSTSSDAKTSDDCWGKTVRLKKDSGKIGRLVFESDLVGAFGDKFVIEMDFFAVDSGDSNEKFSVETKVNGSWCLTGKNMTYDDGKWNHLAFVLDTSTGEYKILVNGEESSKGYQDAGTNLSIRIGFNNDSTKFDAYVDNVRIAAGTTPNATAATATVSHTPGEAVHENEVAAQPGVAGSYDEVVYCSVCGEELSRENKAVPALKEAVTVNFDDQAAGSAYDGEYFKAQGDALTSDDCWGKAVHLKDDTSNDKKTGYIRFDKNNLVTDFGSQIVIEADFYVINSSDHASKFNAEVKLNGSWAVYGANTSYEENKWNHIALVFDSSAKTYAIYVNGTASASGDIADEIQTIDVIALGFSNDATGFDAYVDNVVISAGTTPTATAPTATVNHTPGEAVHENEVEPQIGVAGSYDEVVYCSVCGEELSREHKSVDALTEPATEPVTEPVTDEPDPSTQTSDLISVFTVIAAIALAGTAFAIKKKRG